MNREEIFQNWKNINDNFLKYNNIKSVKIIDNCNIEFKPLVSIMIPTYKRKELLMEALHSAINQNTNIEFEVCIISNDPDEIKVINKEDFAQFKNFRYYVNEKNIGMFGNINRCFELAMGKYVCVLHDDDMITNNYILEISKYIECDFDVLCPHPMVLDERKGVKNYSYPKAILNLLKNKGPSDVLLKDYYELSGVSPIGALFNKEKFFKYGGYDEEYYPSSDIMFLMKVLANGGNIKYLPRNIVIYRYLENESLSLETCREFVYDTYYIFEILSKEFNINYRKKKKDLVRFVSIALDAQLTDEKDKLYDIVDLKYTKNKTKLKLYKLRNTLNVLGRMVRK